MKKSSVEEIQAKFDQLAERYSNLETGQDNALDSPLSMKLIAKAAKAYNPNANQIMDVGCGGGNYVVKLTSQFPNADVTLQDLSANMLDTAAQRVAKNISGSITKLQGDYREVDFGVNRYDIVTAATTLHHLRTEEEWKLVFQKIYQSLKPGGSFWISDIILHDHPHLNELMHQGWFNWLENRIGAEGLAWTKDQYAKEDTPQTLNFQLEMMKKVGFSTTQILHKHLCFAVFGAIK